MGTHRYYCVMQTGSRLVAGHYDTFAYHDDAFRRSCDKWKMKTAAAVVHDFRCSDFQDFRWLAFVSTTTITTKTKNAGKICSF